MHIYPTEQCEARAYRVSTVVFALFWLGIVRAMEHSVAIEADSGVCQLIDLLYVYCVIQYCKCSDGSRVKYAYTNIHIIIIRLDCNAAPLLPPRAPKRVDSEEEGVFY